MPAIATRGCPKCNAPMAIGFVVDHTYGGQGVSVWQGGEPRPSFWTGVKRSKADQIRVQTYRCPRCGYLESYAVSP